MKYTVVILRPEGLSDQTDVPYGKDVYVALVQAKDIVDAVLVAKKEAADADRKDGLFDDPITPFTYQLCVLFEGHHDVKLFGWQPH